MTKISDLLSTDPVASLDGTEAIPVVTDPTGTPANAGATIEQVGDYVATREEIPSWAKKVCRVATTGNHSLSGLANVDGKTISDGNRILVRAQTAPSENGIYIAHSGAWTRANIMNTANDAAGAVVVVRFGATYGGTLWRTDFDGDDTLGTTAMNWYELVDTSDLSAYALISDLSTEIRKLSAKASVKCATTSNITLSGLPKTIDGVTVSTAGVRVLVFSQTSKAENGIYLSASGAWTRAEDFDSAAEAAGAIVSIQEGTQWGGYNVFTTFKGSDTLGTTDMNWYQFNSEANTVSIAEGFLLYNQADGTKQITFDAQSASGTGVWNLIPPATAGTHELVGRTATQTLTNKTVNVDNNTFSGTKGLPFEMIVAVGDETTAHTTGTAKVTFRMPRAVTLSKIKGSVTTAPTGATLFQFDVNKNGSSLFSTNPTFDASEKTTETAATASVLGTTAVAADDEITIDIDAIGSTIAGAGLKVTLIGVYQ